MAEEKNFEELYKAALVQLDQRAVENERKHKALIEQIETNKKLKAENRSLTGKNHELRETTAVAEKNTRNLTNNGEKFGKLINDVFVFLLEHTSIRNMIEQEVRSALVKIKSEPYDYRDSYKDNDD